jgi:pimeloyl-ACP methyl ester carboxylesterase
MTTLRAGRLELEVLRRGKGAPILVIHGVNPISSHAPFVDRLAEYGEVIAPSHPGFGASERPYDFDTMYDLVNLYLDVLDAIPAERVTVIGLSFGGWIAAELAVTGARKIDRLILADPVGIKIGGREERDIVHFFNTSPDELIRRSWADPSLRPDGVYALGWQATITDAMTDAEMVALARNWDSLCLYAWKPHMYNPQLAYWLRRIVVPTLVLWGDHDRIVTPSYGRAYADLIPGARFELIPNAGHHPDLEQPEAFVEQVVRFMGKDASR